MPPIQRILGAALPACAPLPALIVGIVAMRDLGVTASVWLTNVAAAVLGLLIFAFGRRLAPPTRGTPAWIAGASIAVVLLPFASEGVLGVYRWISVGGLRLHASAVVAPLIILCVAAAASHRSSIALAISVTTALILALQPDAAQTTSFAVACAVIIVHAMARQTQIALIGFALLLATSVISLIRHDPLLPVAHVEGIFGMITSAGLGPAVVATVALLLLPAPFFAAWHRHRRPTALALGIYIAATVVAPAWGAFPVPVMGYGASPILGYFVALAVAIGGPSRIGELAETPPSLSST